MLFLNTKVKYTNKNSILDRFIFLLYSMYFIMKPFYFWSSGLPQIADMILVLLIILFLLKRRFSFRILNESKKVVFTGWLFVIYVVITNSIWSMVLGEPNHFMVSSIFYIYNFIIFLIVIGLYVDYNVKIIEITYVAILLSAFIQIILFVIEGGFTGGRMTTGFNNPNQLGYYSLLVLSILILTSRRIDTRLFLYVGGVVSSLILVMVSLSKAAIVSYIGLLLFYILSFNKNKKIKRKFIIVVLIFAGLITYIYQFTPLIQDNQLFQSVEKRIKSIGKAEDDNLEARGYNRITEYPEYWIFGSGEGEYSRFGDINKEFHSTLGNIQVSYGLIGFLLFLGFLYLSSKNTKHSSWYIILFILAYGVTHNGIRNSLFWIFVALVSLTNEHLKRIDNHFVLGEHEK